VPYADARIPAAGLILPVYRPNSRPRTETYSGLMRVAVIGAGIIGAAVADALARRGASVTVLDMRGAGRGASQASAGVLAPYTEAQGKHELLSLCVRSFDRFDEFVADVADRSGRSVVLERCGTLEVALTPEEAAYLQRAHAWLSQSGVASEWIDARDIRAIDRSVTSASAGALRVGAHGFVPVTALVHALVQSARLSGAAFEAPVAAVDVAPAQNDVQIRAAGRSYTADHVVVAAGSWSGRIRIAGAKAPPVRPIRGQLLHLDWSDAASRPSTIVWGHACYVVPWSDGSVLVGATVEDAGFDESSTVAGVQTLMSAVTRLLPGAAGASLRDVRVGLRPAAPDELPIVGPLASAPNVTLATAHYRNGILLAPLTAHVVAEYVIDGTIDPSMTLTSPNRFASAPTEHPHETLAE